MQSNEKSPAKNESPIPECYFQEFTPSVLKQAGVLDPEREQEILSMERHFLEIENTKVDLTAARYELKINELQNITQLLQAADTSPEFQHRLLKLERELEHLLQQTPDPQLNTETQVQELKAIASLLKESGQLDPATEEYLLEAEQTQKLFYQATLLTPQIKKEMHEIDSLIKQADSDHCEQIIVAKKQKSEHLIGLLTQWDHLLKSFPDH